MATEEALVPHPDPVAELALCQWRNRSSETNFHLLAHFLSENGLTCADLAGWCSDRHISTAELEILHHALQSGNWTRSGQPEQQPHQSDADIPALEPASPDTAPLATPSNAPPIVLPLAADYNTETDSKAMVIGDCKAHAAADPFVITAGASIADWFRCVICREVHSPAKLQFCRDCLVSMCRSDLANWRRVYTVNGGLAGLTPCPHCRASPIPIAPESTFMMKMLKRLEGEIELKCTLCTQSVKLVDRDSHHTTCPAYVNCLFCRTDTGQDGDEIKRSELCLHVERVHRVEVISSAPGTTQWTCSRLRTSASRSTGFAVVLPDRSMLFVAWACESVLGFARIQHVAIWLDGPVIDHLKSVTFNSGGTRATWRDFRTDLLFLSVPADSLLDDATLSIELGA
jgi:hypothetical protein